MSEPAAGRDKEKVRGFWFGLGAYALWGALPIYFKALDGIGDLPASRARGTAKTFWLLDRAAAASLSGKALS